MGNHIAEPQDRHTPEEEDESVLHLTTLLDAKAVDDKKDRHKTACDHTVVDHGDVNAQSTHEYLEVVGESQRLAGPDADHRDDILPPGDDGPYLVESTLGVVVCATGLRQYGSHLAVDHTGPDAHEQREKGEDDDPGAHQSHLRAAAREDTDTYYGADGHAY